MLAGLKRMLGIKTHGEAREPAPVDATVPQWVDRLVWHSDDAPEPVHLRPVTLDEAFPNQDMHRWKYPAGRKARRVLANQGRRVNAADERAMTRHRKRSLAGMNGGRGPKPHEAPVGW